MKILVIGQYYYPEDFRINDICEELVRKGNEVTVVTGIPNYPKGVIFEGYEDSYIKPEIRNGVKIIRCNNRPRKTGTLNLLLNYYTYVWQANKIVKHLDRDYDIIYGYQMSPVMQIIPAIKYKKKNKTPLYVYVCDLWPESILDVGDQDKLSKKSLIYRYFLHLSKKIYNAADMLGVKCNEFIDYLVEVCGVDGNKCCLNYEHAEDNYLQVEEKPLNNGIIDFMYLGNIGHSSNCNLIVEAASQLSGNNYKIHFVGDGSELENLKKRTIELGLEERIVFYGRHAQAEMIDFYNLADVCLLTLQNKSAIGLTPPAKLTGYMAACRPIVASIDGAAKKIIEEADCGVVCSADDVKSLSKLMQKIIDNPTVLSSKGINGRCYFLEKFTLDKHVSELEKQLLSLIER